MRISELAATTGVAVPTLKYYLREGLLAPGTAVSATRSSYAAAHVERVRLIRALVTGAGLSIADVKAVTTALDDPPTSWHELLGHAQRAIRPAVRRSGRGSTRDAAREESPAASSTSGADALLDRLGWRVEGCSPVRDELEAALRHAADGGIDVPDVDLEAYATAMSGVAAVDVASVPMNSPEAAVRQVILGTVLLEPVLSALRRLAQEDLSARRSDASAPRRRQRDRATV